MSTRDGGQAGSAFERALREAWRDAEVYRLRRRYAQIGTAREERRERAFRAWMDALPLTPKQKALLALKLDGVSHRRIAAAWGISRQAVERMWARTKRRLAAGGSEAALAREMELFRLDAAAPEARRAWGWQGVYLETVRMLGR